MLERANRLEKAIIAFGKAMRFVNIEKADEVDQGKAALRRRLSLYQRLGRHAEAQADFLEAKRVPARAPHIQGSRFTPIDLRSHLNQGLQDFGLTRTMGATNSTAPLRTLGGVEFEMCGYVWLKLGDLDPDFPPRASGIEVAQ